MLTVHHSQVVNNVEYIHIGPLENWVMHRIDNVGRCWCDPMMWIYLDDGWTYMVITEHHYVQ